MSTQVTAPVNAHEYGWHPLGVSEQFAGTSSTGSASCSCGGWSANVLDNRAGAAAAREGHREHLVAARRARITEIADRLDNLDYHPAERGLRRAIDDVVADLRAANCI